MEYQYLQLPAPGPWPAVDERENVEAATPPNPDQNVIEDEENNTHIIVIQL